MNVVVSVCCELDTYLRIDGNNQAYICTKCNKQTTLKSIDYKLYRKKIDKNDSTN